MPKPTFSAACLAVPKGCPLEKAFSPGQPRLKPFLMEARFRRAEQFAEKTQNSRSLAG
jgi:hypothetical protein